MGDEHKFYDVSPKQREIIEWKHNRKMILREEYLKRIHHPTKYHMVGDDAVQRFAALKMSYDQFFKPSFRNFLSAVAVFGSIVGFASFLTWSKEKQEKLYRTGQVSYSDRPFKFQ